MTNQTQATEMQKEIMPLPLRIKDLFNSVAFIHTEINGRSGYINSKDVYEGVVVVNEEQARVSEIKLGILLTTAQDAKYVYKQSGDPRKFAIYMSSEELNALKNANTSPEKAERLLTAMNTKPKNPGLWILGGIAASVLTIVGLVVKSDIGGFDQNDIDKALVDPDNTHLIEDYKARWDKSLKRVEKN